MKKVIGWTVIAGMSGLMLGAGLLLSIEKEETVSKVQDAKINVEDSSTQEDSAASDPGDAVKDSVPPEELAPEYKENVEPPEDREKRLAREAALREKHAKESGEFVYVISPEGENTYVEGVIRNVDHLINYGKTESNAIRVMHLMTHQKIQADEKWGAAPMTPITTARLVETLEKHPEYDPELLRVAKMWAANDFSEIDAQHNYLNTLLQGTVDEGHATGIATLEEEKEFVLKYFDPGVAQELGFQ